MLIVRTSLRSALTLAVLGAVVAIATAWWLGLPGKRASRPERWFAPGPLGHEAGRAVPLPGPAAFLSRHIGGLGSPAAAAWARHNGLTPALSFSHNLNTVFPPTLFAEYPDFFPMVNGKRERPAEHSQSWNPDLGRPDVAIHAANHTGVVVNQIDPAGWQTDVVHQCRDFFVGDHFANGFFNLGKTRGCFFDTGANRHTRMNQNLTTIDIRKEIGA